MTAIADTPDNSTVEQLAQTVADLHEVVKTQAERIAQQDDRINDLETELAEYRNHNERDKAQIRQKITSVENTVDDIDQNASAGEPTGEQDKIDDSETEPETETPLETICALPEHLAARELSANQERARFLATDIRDYAEKCPAGLVIDSRAIKRVIAAKEGDRPHTQTVARVMDFLDRLGKDAVELQKRRGRKLVAIDPEAADRFTRDQGDAAGDHGRCDQGRGPSPTESVIGSV